LTYYLKAVWSDIQKEQRWLLISRSFLVSMSSVIYAQAAKVLPLVEISLVLNTTPLVTAVLGYFLLRDVLKSFDIAMLIISCIGVTILLLS